MNQDFIAVILFAAIAYAAFGPIGLVAVGLLLMIKNKS